MRDRALERRLEVYLRHDLVGHLWLDHRRRFVFQYDTAWLKRKSPVCPLVPAPEGRPVLSVEMLAFTYRNRPYEYRISYCLTEGRKLLRKY